MSALDVEGYVSHPVAGYTPPCTTKEDTITELMEEHLEDLEIRSPLENIEFELGDNVVYPHHGAGKVLRKELKEVLGETREYLTIKILHNDMTVMVPTENAALAGLRRVIDEDTVKKVLAVLQDDCSEMPKNWNRRFKHNRDKIKTGDIYELAEVVRNLAVRECEKGLSTGEKQMYTRAKKILASELMYALELGEEEAEAHLDDLLLESAHEKLALAK
jgi:CarD family transcriptional regulator